ncbi:hypothetical protein B0H14DRAFT_3171355 [Mycena olivaceomarginata]|nr:hypothetical protein B0H14DRAFT_3171355 [Mycena olivaceomarginata]
MHGRFLVTSVRSGLIPRGGEWPCVTDEAVRRDREDEWWVGRRELWDIVSGNDCKECAEGLLSPRCPLGRGPKDIQPQPYSLDAKLTTTPTLVAHAAMAKIIAGSVTQIGATGRTAQHDDLAVGIGGKGHVPPLLLKTKPKGFNIEWRVGIVPKASIKIILADGSEVLDASQDRRNGPQTLSESNMYAQPAGGTWPSRAKWLGDSQECDKSLPGP